MNSRSTINRMQTQQPKLTRGTPLRPIHKDIRGLSTVEYVIILVIIAVTAITAWKKFGGTITGKVKSANTEIEKL